ncbi:maternal protein exuperantia [Harmonia axyridis]|uniref:maternal protein exuperantia n=1 Tax=Harmonia axyridis TaxID=115357 RepID=UPI001E278526|nr:maternal protein exuperantia [Harmonia axyridis]XP_045483180.1 maternal protein exuperantia [Harmonia axyridis]
MVQNEESVSGNDAPVYLPDKPARGVANGKYRMVGWEIDTTGRRLIDEICQIAAYTPKSQFSQYIMPYADINPPYVRKHALRVVNAGRYRMLRDIKNNTFIKTKSEISALTDFLQWLEENRGDATDGIILIYHENRKAAPGMLLEALRRYELLNRFNNVVKGFANGYEISSSKCGNTTKAFTLRMMAKILLGYEGNDFTSAKERAKSTYEIAIHLAQGEKQDLDSKACGDSTGLEPHLIEFICPFTNPIIAEEEEIIELKDLLKIQNTFRPVFRDLLSGTRLERKHASHLRRLLAENNINYDKLKEAYETEAKEGLDKILKSEVANAEEKDLTELLEILDCFFDPEKKPVQPKVRFYPNQNNNRKQPRQRRNSNRQKNKKTSEPMSPNISSDNPTDSVSDASPRSEIKEPEVITLVA